MESLRIKDEGIDVSINTEVPFTPARVTLSDTLGCVGMAALVSVGPALAISGKGNLRKVGIGLTIAETVLPPMIVRSLEGWS